MTDLPVEIVPAINVLDFATLQSRIRIAEQVARTIHIDVADGTFTPSAVWDNPEELRGFGSKAKIEIHLMVARPDEQIARWFMPEVARIIVHAEAAQNLMDIIGQCHEAKTEAGISICPDTPWEVLVPYIAHADLLQLLAITPGPSGQAFDRRILTKLQNLKRLAPHMPLEVDGGIKVGTAHECKQAGANLLVAASALFADGVSLEEAYIKLRNDVE